MTGSSFHQSHVGGSKPKDQNRDNTTTLISYFTDFKAAMFPVCEAVYLRSYLGGLLGVDGSHVLIVFERVLSVLLLCTHVLL